MLTPEEEWDAIIDERNRVYQEFHGACANLFWVVMTELHIVSLFDWIHRHVRGRT